MNEERVRALLEKVVTQDTVDSNSPNLNHEIWDAILNEIGIEKDFNAREDYYEIFIEYEFGMINADDVINLIGVRQNH